MTIYTRFEQDTTQTKIKKLEMLKEHCKIMADVLASDEVKNVITKWQGKKYTKRFQTALQKVNKHFHISTRYGVYLEFNFYDIEERSFYDEKTGHIIYISHDKHTIKMVTQTSWGEGSDIVADDLAEQVAKSAEYYLIQYEKLDAQIKNINKYIEEFCEIVNKYNEFENKVDANISDEFNFILQLRTRN